MGYTAERCRWQKKRGGIGAAVERRKEKRKPAARFGHRKPEESLLLRQSKNRHYGNAVNLRKEQICNVNVMNLFFSFVTENDILKS